MTGTDWAILIPAVVGVLGAVGSYLKAAAAAKSAAAAHQRIDTRTIKNGNGQAKL